MIELPKLPYGESDLAPHISQETISFHYGKHHKAYVDNLNKFAEGTKYASMSLEEVVKAHCGRPLAEIQAQVLAAVRRWSNSGQEDDMTLMLGRATDWKQDSLTNLRQEAL